MYRPEIDVAAIDAIDIHVHIEVDAQGHPSMPSDIVAAFAKYFSQDGPLPTLPSVAAHYRERNMAAVVFTVDTSTQLEHQPISSIEIAQQAADHADVLIPFGSVDPNHGERAVDLARELVIEHGVRGFKLHPTAQGFDPTDEAIRPLWAAFDELGVPVLVHTGQTGVGAGMPGGRSLRLRYSNPLLLDDILADYPTLQIVMAHPSTPWVDEQISVATHKGNAWIDLSGWSPKYLPASLVRAANSYLQDKVLFGSDFPALTTDRWLGDFAGLDLKDSVRPKILKDNAVSLLKLA